jgi:hypothetical protein
VNVGDVTILEDVTVGVAAASPRTCATSTSAVAVLGRAATAAAHATSARRPATVRFVQN